MKILLLWKELKFVTLALSTIKRGTSPTHTHTIQQKIMQTKLVKISRGFTHCRPNWLTVTRLTHSCEFSWFF